MLVHERHGAFVMVEQHQHALFAGELARYLPDEMFVPGPARGRHLCRCEP
ncbi:MAG: DUF3891 family protein [Thermoflavifilum sp.]|nr:DUF3891 family protein [Thermoflavifilum sp.]MCL6514689.1 DUF3891 family protein [Alicyclobacillus sp.]